MNNTIVTIEAISNFLSNSKTQVGMSTEHPVVKETNQHRFQSQTHFKWSKFSFNDKLYNMYSC